MPRKKVTETKKTEAEIKVKKRLSYYQAVGRRKTASALVRLQVNGSGKIIVNQKPIEEYFPGEVAKKLYSEPLVLTNNPDRFDIFAKIEGSGKSAQLGAFIHGLSRALQEVSRENYRPLLKKRGFLTRDPRARERRKPGQAGRARAKKQSPKR